MTYQGARARPEASEVKRVFSVSKVRLDPAGRVSAVLWNQVDAKSNGDLSPAMVVPVADVIDALHDGAEVAAVFPGAQASGGRTPELLFEVIEHADGSETIVLQASTAPSSVPPPRLQDLQALDG